MIDEDAVRVVLLGPPGAGKGTQARFLEERSGACRLSTGDILRKAVSDQTSVGKKAKECIDQGKLVPDKVMVDLIAERLHAERCVRGFILDGFPRTVAQAEALEHMLGDLGSAIDCALCIQVPRQVIIQRLAGRWACRQCGTLYHAVFDPPSREGICNRCGGELDQREDDRAETVATRLDVYENQTVPLIDYYRKKGLLKEIDGVGSVEEIQGRALRALGLRPELSRRQIEK